VTRRWTRIGIAFSEFAQGTFADYAAVPKRNAIPLPDGMSALDASVLGTAWLTAYRALFTKSRVQPGQTRFAQGEDPSVMVAPPQIR
jgi:NADPH:quinone reductase-like Zn-dependent oxidoreductase